MTQSDDTEHEPTPPTLEDIRQPKILIRIVDSRPPHPGLAVFAVAARPQIGDCLPIETSPGHTAPYRVQFVNYFPNRTVQIDVGCAPVDLAPADGAYDAIAAKKVVDDLVDRQVRIFEKGQAYTNAIIVAGYAGAFGIWSLFKDKLSARGTSAVAILLGISLIIFVTWELAMMILRNFEAKRLFQRVENDPQKFLALSEDFRRLDRRYSERLSRWWIATLLPTIVLGYAAILVLLFNVGADLLGFTKWP